jgi:hypothetical protein
LPLRACLERILLFVPDLQSFALLRLVAIAIATKVVPDLELPSKSW